MSRDRNASSATAPTWAEISRPALASNIEGIRDRVGEDRELWCAVKADAYGHGAVMISRWLKEMNVEGLCVARVSEGAELREAGIPGPISLLTPFLPEQAGEVIAADLEPIITRRDQIDALSGIWREEPTPIHVKVDTGMGRVGVAPGDALEFCRWISDQPGVRLKGICSHFPVADEHEKTFSKKQLQTFLNTAQDIRTAGVDFEHVHIANSAGIMDLPASWGTLVRPGIMIYGLEPRSHVSQSVDLEPVMMLKTRVILVKEVHAGTGISYGLTWIAPELSRIATLPVGYADGLPRIASNRAEVLIRGQRVRQVGRICMDMMMVNVTNVRGGVEVGDEVVIWGTQGEGQVHVDEWASWSQTINYEMTTRVGPRVPRLPSPE